MAVGSFAVPCINERQQQLMIVIIHDLIVIKSILGEYYKECTLSWLGPRRPEQDKQLGMVNAHQADQSNM